MPEAKESLPYRVLARKYRPVDFTTLVGQEAMVRTLRNAIATGRIAHAFMLTGVRGVGKTTTARIISRALNCVGPDGTGGPTVDPCGVCEHCVAIQEDRDVDVIEMDAASRTGVADARELIEGVRYRPVSARYKVYIIDEVHMLSTQAFNALLKTLEEPPPHVKFVFATTEIRKVPVTVLSRCQRFDLKRVPQDVLVAHFGKIAELEKVEISPEALALVARAADGSVRDGLSMLDQAIAHGGGVVRCRAGARHAGPGRPQPRAGAVREDHARRRAGGRRGAGRDARCRRRSGRDPAGPARAHPLGDAPQGRPEAGASNADSERAQGLAMAGKLSMASLTRAWSMLMKGLQETLTAPSPVRAAEMALIRLCYAADLPSPSDALKALQSGGTHGGGTVRLSGAARRRGWRWRGGPSRPATGVGRGAAAGAGRGAAAGAGVAPQPAQAAAAQSQELHRGRGAVRGPARAAAGQLPDAPRARGALRAGPDRVPARADGTDRPRLAAERAAGQMDRPALDRLGVERRGQADPVAAEDGQRRHAAQPRPRPIRWCRPY